MVGYDPGAQDAGLAPEEAVLAGSAAGMVTRALISPFDVLKIRFQVWICPYMLLIKYICTKAKYSTSAVTRPLQY